MINHHLFFFQHFSDPNGCGSSTLEEFQVASARLEEASLKQEEQVRVAAMAVGYHMIKNKPSEILPGKLGFILTVG